LEEAFVASGDRVTDALVARKGSEDPRPLAAAGAVTGYLPVAIALLTALAISRSPQSRAWRSWMKRRRPDHSHAAASASAVSSTPADVHVPDRAGAVALGAQAVAKVKRGDVLAAVVIPRNIAARLSSNVVPAHLEVIYNGDALEQSLVQSTINSLLRRQIRLLRRDPAGRGRGDRPASGSGNLGSSADRRT